MIRTRLLSIAGGALLVGVLAHLHAEERLPSMQMSMGQPPPGMMSQSPMGQSFGGPGMGGTMGAATQQSPDQFAQMANQIPPDLMAQMAQQGADEVHKALAAGGEPAVQKLIDEMKSTMRQAMGAVPPEIEQLTVKDLIDMAKEIPASGRPPIPEPSIITPQEPFVPPAIHEPPTKKSPKMAEPQVKVTDVEKKNMQETLERLQKHAELLQSKGIGDSIIAKRIRTVDQLLADLIIAAITLQKPEFIVWLAQPSEKRLWGILENLSRKLTEQEPQVVEPLVDYADYLDNPYKLLQITPDAKAAEINRAYQKLAAPYEPKAKEAALRAAGALDDDIKHELRLAKLNRQQLQNARDLLLDKNLRVGVDKRLGASLQRYQYQSGAAKNLLSELTDTIMQVFYKYDLNNAVDEFLRRRAPEELEMRKTALRAEHLQLEEQKRRGLLRPVLSSSRQAREEFRTPTPTPGTLYRDVTAPWNTGYYPGSSYGMPPAFDPRHTTASPGATPSSDKKADTPQAASDKDKESTHEPAERESKEFQDKRAKAAEVDRRPTDVILRTIKTDLERVKLEVEADSAHVLEDSRTPIPEKDPNKPSDDLIKQWTAGLRIEEIARNMSQLRKVLDILTAEAIPDEQTMWQEITSILENVDEPLKALSGKLDELTRAPKRSAEDRKAFSTTANAIKSIAKEQKTIEKKKYFERKLKTRFEKQKPVEPKTKTEEPKPALKTA